MGKLNKLPFHPVLFSLFPSLFLLSKNIGELTVAQLGQPLILSISLVILVWVLINFIVADRRISAATASILVLMFFSYSFVDRLFFWFRFPTLFYLFIMIALAFFITLKLLKSKTRVLKATIILNIISFAIIILPSFNIIIHEIKRERTIKGSDISSPHFLVGSNFKKPDIYYIVPDSYASNSTLKDYFNFDNSEFTDYLKSKGFYVADKSKSNYPFTTPSLASSLNTIYLDEIVKIIGVNSQDQTPLFKVTEDNQLVFYLKSKGYKYYHFGPLQLPTTSNKNADYNYTYASNQLVLSPLTGLLLEQTLLTYMISGVNCASASSIFCIGTLNNRRSRYNYTLDQISRLEDAVRDEGPKFIFYHNLLTHVPYMFDENGKYIPRAVEASKDRRENYINQLKFTNKMLKQIIDAILKDSKEPPVIILQSDEGPYPERFIGNNSSFDWREASKDELKEKFGILNAYYLPQIETKLLNPGITPVNTFRIILNEYFGEQLPLLPDINYAQTKYHRSYDLFDVTDIMK